MGGSLNGESARNAQPSTPVFVPISHFSTWSCDEVVQWATIVAFEDPEVFRDHRIEGFMLTDLTDDQLKLDLNLCLGDQMRFKKQLALLTADQNNHSWGIALNNSSPNPTITSQNTLNHPTIISRRDSCSERSKTLADFIASNWFRTYVSSHVNIAPIIIIISEYSQSTTTIFQFGDGGSLRVCSCVVNLKNELSPRFTKICELCVIPWVIFRTANINDIVVFRLPHRDSEIALCRSDNRFGDTTLLNMESGMFRKISFKKRHICFINENLVAAASNGRTIDFWEFRETITKFTCHFEVTDDTLHKLVRISSHRLCIITLGWKKSYMNIEFVFVDDPFNEISELARLTVPAYHDETRKLFSQVKLSDDVVFWRNKVVLLSQLGGYPRLFYHDVENKNVGEFEWDKSDAFVLGDGFRMHVVYDELVLFRNKKSQGFAHVWNEKTKSWENYCHPLSSDDATLPDN